MYQRAHIKKLARRLNEPRRFIQVVMGPRQVGKTTLVTQLLAKAAAPYTFESADNVSNPNSVWLQQVWETARIKMKASGAAEYLLVVDEIQKIPNWSEVVKQQWDADTRKKIRIKVLLLGSARLLIQTGLTESLAGRFEIFYVGHWSYSEMHAAFGWSLEQYVYFGGYPGSSSLVYDEVRWKSYVRDSLIETSISRDILLLTRVDKPALLKRLFEVGSQYSGQILSLNKLMGELQEAGNTTTLSHYLHLLSDSGLLGGLEKYAGSIIRRRASHPKFQVHNNALLNAQSSLRFSQAAAHPKYWGRLVESAVGAHLVNHALTEDFRLHYWREGVKEVDFVLEHKGALVGIEVKSGYPNPNKMSGMAEFAQQFNPQKMFLVGASGIPLAEFLKINPMELFDN